MRVKLDENLPLRLATLLEELGHDVRTVYDEQLVGHPDDEVWAAAQSEGRFLITQDMDFSDMRNYLPGSHCGILLIRLRTPAREALTNRVAEIFTKEAFEKFAGCFVVATERKLRIRRSPVP